MHEQIDVVYENGVLRPLGPLPYPLEEHQQFTVILEGSARGRDWLADADPSIRLARRSMLLSAPTLLHFDQKNSTSEIHV